MKHLAVFLVVSSLSAGCGSTPPPTESESEREASASTSTVPSDACGPEEATEIARTPSSVEPWVLRELQSCGVIYFEIAGASGAQLLDVGASALLRYWAGWSGDGSEAWIYNSDTGLTTVWQHDSQVWVRTDWSCESDELTPPASLQEVESFGRFSSC